MHLEEVTIEDTVIDERFDPPFGFAVSLSRAGDLFLKKCAIWNGGTGGVLAKDSPAFVRIEDTTVANTVGPNAQTPAIGVAVNLGAHLETHGLVVLGTGGSQLHVQAAETYAFIENTYLHGGVEVLLEGPQGSAVSAPGLTILRGATVHAAGLSVDRAVGIGILIGHRPSLLQGHSILAQNTRSSEADGHFGDGLSSPKDATLLLDRSVFRRNARGGLVLQDGAGILQRLHFDSNAIGLNVQGGTALVELKEVPEEVEPLELLIEESCVFQDNRSRLGGGALPLPDIDSFPSP
jgi:hypothetical protein